MSVSDQPRPLVSWGALLVKTRGGDLEAFEELVRVCEPRLLRTALRITRHLEDAQDATQEAFLRLYRSRGRFDDRRPLEPWLLKIVVNEALALIARRPPSSTAPLEAAPSSSLATRSTPSRSFEENELATILEDALDLLPPRLRAVFALRDMEGLSTREIAGILGCTQITVRRHSAEARSRVRRDVKRRYPGVL